MTNFIQFYLMSEILTSLNGKTLLVCTRAFFDRLVYHYLDFAGFAPSSTKQLLVWYP